MSNSFNFKKISKVVFYPIPKNIIFGNTTEIYGPFLSDFQNYAYKYTFSHILPVLPQVLKPVHKMECVS